MKRNVDKKEEKRVVEIQCKYCEKTLNMEPGKTDLHVGNWRLITKESDNFTENFYLCHECFLQYKSK